MEDRPLPDPDTAELDPFVRDATTRAIYRLLHLRRNSPPTMVEIRAFVADQASGPLSQTDRRLRDLRRHFDVEAVRDKGEYRYHLTGWNVLRYSEQPEQTPISSRIRAQVLAPGRCAQCGRTPLTHGVVLVVDHRIPQNWGGGNEIENLQPLCEECNHGKRDFYSSHDAHASAIRAAISYEEPHKRIGELLKAFNGEWVPGELIGIVASAVQYQEDWQKRLRELRTLGWVITPQKRHNEATRVRTYYRVEHWEPWPEGAVVAEVRRRERERKARRAAGGSDDAP